VREFASVALGRSRSQPGATSGHVGWAYGAFLLVRRTALEAAGGFGAHAELYGEDLDLAWRLARAGWRVRYEPSAIVVHDESAATAKAWGTRRERRRTAAGYAWIAGRRGRPRALAIAGIQAGAYLTRGRPRAAAGEVAGALRGLRDPRWRDL
jgi:GT2 family glycosyltransferase